MRRVRGLFVVLACSSGTGCFAARPSAPDSFLCIADRNIVEAPIRDHDELKFIKVARKEAEKQWKQVVSASGQPYSPAYHEGFIEGFVDYVQAGGSGEPPYLPPFRYRLTQDRSPEGVTKIEDWYAGFRQGSSVAHASGLRQLSLIPLPAYAVPQDLNAIYSEPNTQIPVAPGPRDPREGSPWERPGVPALTPGDPLNPALPLNSPRTLPPGGAPGGPTPPVPAPLPGLPGNPVPIPPAVPGGPQGQATSGNLRTEAPTQSRQPSQPARVTTAVATASFRAKTSPVAPESFAEPAIAPVVATATVTGQPSYSTWTSSPSGNSGPSSPRLPLLPIVPVASTVSSGMPSVPGHTTLPTVEELRSSGSAQTADAVSNRSQAGTENSGRSYRAVPATLATPATEAGQWHTPGPSTFPVAPQVNAADPH